MLAKPAKKRTGLKYRLTIPAITTGLIIMAETLFPSTSALSTTLPQINQEIKEQSIINVEQPWEKAFHQQITEWIAEIAGNEGQYQEWLRATYETYPFGPGSKQWVVLIFKDKQEIGYLIMGQAMDQPIFHLIEYGHTKESVFSRELKVNPAFFTEKFFYHGLLWAKTEANTLVDLITHEKYAHVPLDKVEPWWSGELVGLLERQFDFTRSLQKEPVVFVTLAETQETISPDNFEQAEDYFYRAKLLPEVIGLYNVSSLHYWQGMEQIEKSTLFIGLEDEGTRYLAYPYLAQIGTFAEMN